LALLHDELMAAFATWNADLAGAVARDTPLLSSGRLDSVALFQLVLWIEHRLGRPIDVTLIDMKAEWDTVDAIVAFVEREREGR
jgi:acyl carrier protein